MTAVPAAWLAPIAAGLAASYLTVRLIERRAAALRLIDQPNLRSSHRTPRPRGGGLGIVVGSGFGMAVAWIAGLQIESATWVVLAAAVAMSALGFVDDLRSLGVGIRLAVQVAVALGVVMVLGGIDRLALPPPFDVPLGAAGTIFAVIWLVGVTNFFNFMDGVDGFAAGQAIVSFGAIAWVLGPASAALLAVAALAASAGFLLRNWSPAKIFMGDVGSAFLGCLLAALPLAASPTDRPRLILLVAVSLTLFLLDPVATLVVRARRGARVGEAHREHAYQRLIAPDHSHAPGVTSLLAAGLALSIVAVAAYLRPALAWPAVGAALLVFAAEWLIAGRKSRGKSPPL